ncbi:hypothetical protein ACFPM0_28690 [Pseudonocardia sulfidoxydans]|uniref:hypothetical protein n=1 Tax=Pseudonocardia sulfidoxydans TaxID=54011 RepID=UPI003613D8D0
MRIRKTSVPLAEPPGRPRDDIPAGSPDATPPGMSWCARNCATRARSPSGSAAHARPRGAPVPPVARNLSAAIRARDDREVARDLPGAPSAVLGRSSGGHVRRRRGRRARGCAGCPTARC